MQRRISTVLELAKYRVGDSAWWVILRPIAPIEPLKDEDEWMNDHHPKVLFTYGLRKALWNPRSRLPKLQHQDFAAVMNILTSRLVIEHFPVCDLTRSYNTGEFFYENDKEEWVPEDSLFKDKPSAAAEFKRIKLLLRKWSIKS